MKHELDTQHSVETEGKGPQLSRRKLLASLGIAGAAAAATGLMQSVGLGAAYANADTTVTGSVYGPANNGPDHWKDLLGLNYCLTTTVAELRLTADPLADYGYYVLDQGQEGLFLYDATDTATPDNTGTVLVSSNGKRFKRVLGDTIFASWFGPKGDAVTPDTAALQAALYAAAGRKLYIARPQGAYYLTGQLFVPSNIAIELEPGTVLQAVDTLRRTAPYERMIRIKDAKNVTLIGNGAVFRMNKAAFTSGEQAHIFDISGSENVTIENVSANDSGGDGFYIGAYEAATPYSRNIVIRNCIANNNRRQGMSIISVDGLLVEGCRFTNTKGTAPQSGVDIEPNSAVELIRGIRFVNCAAEGNTGRGFLVTLLKPTATSERVDITFENCRTKANSFGYSVNYGGDGTKGVQGEVKLIDCIAENEQYAGFSDLSCSADSVRRLYVRCRAINCNTVNQPEDPYGYGSSFIVTTVPQQVRLSIGNVAFLDCESIDSRAAGLIRRGFSLKRNKTEVIKDVAFTNCRVSGGTNHSLCYVDPIAEQVQTESRVLPVASYIASGDVSPSHTGHKITNAGAAQSIVLKLPVAKAGYTYSFLVDAPFAVTVQPAAGGTILNPLGSGAELSASAPGSAISLLGRADGRWEITNAVGTWLGSGA
ncbi:right-handed parallel beta-helix repeat-containing protein [Paenibacillus sp. HJGM_3]|uniref:right-handed parallel beta-helix repeat-containing protein n=1 Tax=Paenibacillus sp. HJGM_3 TaxID=3379816 RepID=UPI00385CC80C